MTPAAGLARPDLVLLVPALPDAGRVTVSGTHPTREADGLVPVGDQGLAEVVGRLAGSAR